ncbi:MAG TPA: HPF/RaiA family ribosome-associated protein [Flavobacteriales bacterium]|nr:HPF/RaiA family ribosome-associated protein [Flavobacteriales bacterium]
MNVNVHSIHFDADIKLVNFIKEKLNKLTLFHDNIMGGDVTLKVGPDGERPENKHVEIRLSVPGNDLFAKRKGASFEEAAVNAIDALRSQVEKERNKAREVRG